MLPLRRSFVDEYGGDHVVQDGDGQIQENGFCRLLVLFIRIQLPEQFPLGLFEFLGFIAVSLGAPGIFFADGRGFGLEGCRSGE